MEGRHDEKALLYVLSVVLRISQILNQLHDKAIDDVHKWMFVHIYICYDSLCVGIDIAYLQLVGNARASKHGIGNMARFPRFFVVFLRTK